VTRAAASPHYSPAERAAIAFAEAMTVTGQKVTDELFAEARRHFSEAQIVELTAAAALENFRSKFNVALGIESQGFCVLPSR
jgi:alkylhydroperoxidase family enzyme